MSSELSRFVRERLAQADAAVRAGDFAQGRALMEEIARSSPSLDVWMRLAALYRAGGQLNEALNATDKGLSFCPLDFFALLSRASLLDQLGQAEAGEAFGRALAQRPSGQLPPALEAAVEQAKQRFGAWNSERRTRLDQAVSSLDPAPSAEERARIERFTSNALRETRPWHSEPTHFHYPGLIEREFHDLSAFEWLTELEALTPQIKSEFEALAKAERKELVPYVQYADHEPLDQWAELNHSSKWLALHLIQNGNVIEANARHCPSTLDAIRHIDQPMIADCSPNVMFSLLAPGAKIPPHHGVTNTRLVCHLPLIVPPQCVFRVGAETRKWEEGKAFIFDDTIEHEAHNLSDQLRVVLIFDLWHPQLSLAEREAVAALIEVDAGGAVLAL
jgi:aspartyl/asparaginyl beta-hydroxylase (cupin superfamily)